MQQSRLLPGVHAASIADFGSFSEAAGVTEAILTWLTENHSPLSYLVLGAAALIEYVFPPFPGDLISLFGTFLASTAGYHPAAVYLSLTAGAILGSYIAFAFGRRIGDDPDKWPRFMRGKRTRKAIEGAVERFDRHGAAYLVINRFLPALRAVFFVAAGMSGMNASRAMFFGGVSAALWNALILGAGYAVGENWELLQAMLEQYTLLAFTILGIVVLFFLARYLVRRAKRAPEP